MHTSEGERNFHIFYLMLAGATAEQRHAWQLTEDPHSYHYINQSNCYDRRDGVLDSDLWTELNKAMKVLTVSYVLCCPSCWYGVGFSGWCGNKHTAPP